VEKGKKLLEVEGGGQKSHEKDCLQRGSVNSVCKVRKLTNALDVSYIMCVCIVYSCRKDIDLDLLSFTLFPFVPLLLYSLLFCSASRYLQSFRGPFLITLPVLLFWGGSFLLSSFFFLFFSFSFSSLP